MLVLTRKVGQKVNIGFDVVVTVLHVKGNRARLGIECPRDVPIRRSEIVEQILKSFNSYSTDTLQDANCHL